MTKASEILLCISRHSLSREGTWKEEVYSDCFSRRLQTVISPCGLIALLL